MRKTFLAVLAAVVISVAGIGPAAAVEAQASSAQTFALEKSSTAKGWVQKGGVTYYYQNGKKATGWKNIGGNTYYFKTNNTNGPKGKMLIGKQKIKGKVYYFQKTGSAGTKGKMLTGWQSIGGVPYYFKKTGAAGTKGKMLTGWQNIGGAVYYFKTNNTNGPQGKMLIGWQNIKGKTYYFKKTGAAGIKGKMLTGWQNIGGKTYYFKQSGSFGTKGQMFKGVCSISGKKYRFGSDGVLIGEVKDPMEEFLKGIKRKYYAVLPVGENGRDVIIVTDNPTSGASVVTAPTFTPPLDKGSRGYSFDAYVIDGDKIVYSGHVNCRISSGAVFLYKNRITQYGPRGGYNYWTFTKGSYQWHHSPDTVNKKQRKAITLKRA